jgi:hypothetical protein
VALDDSPRFLANSYEDPERARQSLHQLRLAPSSSACSRRASSSPPSREVGPVGPAGQRARGAGLPSGMPGAGGRAGDAELAGDLGRVDTSCAQLGGAQPAGL